MRKAIEFIIALVFFALAAFVLSRDGGYCLLYREQQQLFLFDWNYARDILFQTGGFSILAGRFLVQFFRTPALAVGITSAFLAIGLRDTLAAGRRFGWWSLVAVIPYTVVAFLLRDISFNFELAVAIGIVLPNLLRICSQLSLSRIARWSALPLLVLLYFAVWPAADPGFYRNGDVGTAAYRYEYLVRNQKWDELEKATRPRLNVYSDANYYHLAKAMKGELCKTLFDHPVGGPMSLIYIPQDRSSDARQAHVMYTMGNMAAAQNIAFNVLHTPRGINPEMLKMNVKIELMRREYAVAEKYLEILSKSLFYSEWAEKMKAFLNRDDLVEGDSDLGRGRRDFPSEDGLAMFASPMDELYRILDANPADSKAMEYGLAYLMLAKDINHCFEFIDRYYGSEGLKNLPTSAQEALVFFSEYYTHMDRSYLVENGMDEATADRYRGIDREWCLSHGVRESVYRSFEGFQQAQMSGNMGVINSTYSKTFWRYLIYSQI